MQITIKLDKDFEEALVELQAKYGEKMSLLNGFSEKQLDYTEFIDGFVDSDNIANATIDPNSNATQKDVRGLLDEMGKPHQKLLSYNKIFYEMKKQYGLEYAREWLEMDFNGSLYLHDSSSATFYDYSYKGTEMITVRYKGRVFLVEFSELYDNLTDSPEEVLDSRDGSHVKYTKDLYVWDNKYDWTPVKRVIRRKKVEQHPFHFISTANGHAHIVTSNHPVMTTDGDVDAADVIPGKHKLTTRYMTIAPTGTMDKQEDWALELVSPHRKVSFRGEYFPKGSTRAERQRDGQVCLHSFANPVPNRIVMNYEMGWIVGLVLSSGYIAGDTVRIVNQRPETLERVVDFCESMQWPYSINERSESGAKMLLFRGRIITEVFEAIFGKDFNGKNPSFKHDLLDYNPDFLKGFVGGVLDGDGKPNFDKDGKSNGVLVRGPSRVLQNQIAYIIRMFNHRVIEMPPEIPKGRIYDKERPRRFDYSYSMLYQKSDAYDGFYSEVEKDVTYEFRDKELTPTDSELESVVTSNVVLYDDRDEYVYDITTDTTHFNCNGILSHNCYNYDLTRLAREGLFFLPNTNSTHANHLTTFMAHLREFIVFVSNRSAGACALANFFVWVYYYWSKDVADNYFVKDPEYYLKQAFQQFIYEVNQIHTRIVQSAYTNLVIMDRNYIEELFGDIEYPDGRYVIDHIEDIIHIQKIYMETAAEIRKVQNLTFPVYSYSLLYQDGKFVDEEFARWASDHNTQWYDSNFYIGDSVTSLASCCLEAGESVIVRDDGKIKHGRIKDIVNESRMNASAMFEVLNDGKWCQATTVKLPKRKLYKITTVNGKSVIATDNHIFPTLNGNKLVEDITDEDYLLFTNTALPASTEEGRRRTYNEGMLIGLFVSSGTIYNDTIEIVTDESRLESAKIIRAATDNIGVSSDWDIQRIGLSNKFRMTLKLEEKDWKLVEFIHRYVDNVNKRDMDFSAECIDSTVNFRNGLIDAYCCIEHGGCDGMVEAILTSVGRRHYAHVSSDNVVHEYEGKHYYKVAKIKQCDTDDEFVYCFQMKDFDNPYFTMANGMVTHNCRMLNDIGKQREREAGSRAQQFQSSIGGALVEIGSFKVSTINLAAIAYEAEGNVDKFFQILNDRLQLNMKLLDCVRSIYIRNEEKKLLPTYTYGLKDINKQTGTNGVTAMNEAVELMGMTRVDEFENEYYTDEGLEFAIRVMDTINKAQEEFNKTHEYDISCEVIPGESANAKLAQKDNIRFNKDMKIYSNQWLGLNRKGTIQERVRLSAELDKKAGGGQILHISLEGSFPNKDVAWDMLNYIASQGVIYFAFNPKLYTCKQNHTFMPPQTTCPVCGGGVDQEVTRIVGYLVPTKSFSKPRLEEYNDRRWYTFGDDQYLM